MDICGDILRARIDISGAVLEVFSDSFGGRLFNPPVRLVDVSGEWDFGKLAGFKENLGKCGSTVGVWERLGLIGEDFALTRRGKIFSFFSKGEGLAIAAALEDASYAIEDISFDIANLRAGRRFALSEIKAESSTRMGGPMPHSDIRCDVKRVSSRRSSDRIRGRGVGNSARDTRWQKRAVL